MSHVFIMRYLMDFNLMICKKLNLRYALIVFTTLTIYEYERVCLRAGKAPYFYAYSISIHTHE